MNRKFFFSLFTITALSAAAAAGCSSEATSQDDSTEDDLTDCGGVVNKVTGSPLVSVTKGGITGLSDKKTGRLLTDPVAQLILSSPGTKAGKCPTGFSSIQTKLKTTDKGCDPSIRFVSDSAQETGKATNYRAVVTRSCSDGRRGDHEFFQSLFGIGADGQLPEDLEMIGEERDAKTKKATGIFNYYVRENGQWAFFGSSSDLIADGYNTNADGASVPKAASKLRCAGCHMNGGPIMKELDSPWQGWEGDTQTPGTDAIVTKNAAQVGTKGDGIDMESKVRTASTEWNTAKIKQLRGNMRELLRPLFCTVEFNIHEANRQGAGDLSVPSNMFVNNTFGFVSATIDEKTYNAGLASVASVVSEGGALKDAKGNIVRDKFFGFPFPAQAGSIDDYLGQLSSLNLIDPELQADIQFIDFTRPIYSPTRCALLDLVPTTDTSTIKKADDMRAALIKAFDGKATPGATDLTVALKDPKPGTDARTAAVNALSDACTKRSADATDKTAFAKDVLTYVSHLRKAARRHGNVIEFEPTFPSDNITETKKAFDPKTCKLTLD